MRERKRIRKGLVFGIVLALVLMVFAGVPMNVRANGGTVILNPGHIQGNLIVLGETVTGGTVSASSIPPGYDGYDYDAENGNYHVTVEGGYEYEIRARAQMDEYSTTEHSSTYIFFNLQNTYVDIDETVNLDFSLDPGYIDASVNIIGGDIERILWYAFTNWDSTFRKAYSTYKVEYGHNVYDPETDQWVFHYLDGATIFPAIPWELYDANGDGEYTEAGDDTFTYVFPSVLINDIVYSLPAQYIDVVAGETTTVSWELDVTPGSISGSVNVVGEPDPNNYFIKGNTYIGETLVSIWEQVNPGNQDYYTEVPAADWEIYPEIVLYDPSIPINSFISLKSDPDLVTVAPGENVEHNWNIEPAYVTGSIEVWGAYTNYVGATVYANNVKSRWYPPDAYTTTYTNDYRLVLYEGDWGVGGAPYLNVYFDHDLTYRYLSYDTSNIRLTDYGTRQIENSIPLTAGDIVTDVDFSFGTAMITLNYMIEGGGELWAPTILATQSEGTSPNIISYYCSASGRPEPTTLGEATIVVPAGNNYVQAHAYVEDGSYTKFGEFYIDVEPGDIIIHDIGAPVLDITQPLGFEHVPGTTVLVEGTATDDSAIASITVNGVEVEFTSTNNPDDPNEVEFSTTVEGLVYGENTITVLATDTYDKTTTVERIVISDLQNSPPLIDSISGPDGPVAVNTIFPMIGYFTDPDEDDIHTATWTWGDGETSPGTVNQIEDTVTGSYDYDAPGVYTISLEVIDLFGESDTMEYQYVVVYDPEGGFVTGGGWINSPAGAYVTHPEYPEAMVAYWKLDEGSGITASDSASTNDGTLYGPSWIDGMVDVALSFDGNSHVTIPDSLSLRSPTTALSIEAWVNLQDTSFEHIVAKQYEGVGLPYQYQYNSYVMWAAGGYLWFSVCDGNDQPRVSTQIDTNVWHQVVGVWDGSTSTMQLYIDGQLQASDFFTGFNNILYDDSPCLIGADDNGPSGIPDGFLNGIVDEVAIYNQALTAEEIEQHYNNGLAGKGYYYVTQLEGKANFGFVSKYKKGADTPTGNTEFQFKAVNLNFHSSDYQWLVVAGPKAQFKGTGTINGVGNYGFKLTAIDAKLTPSTDVDMFRIKIWDKDNSDAVVYDNQMGDADDSDPTTAISGGSIVIHKG